MRRNTPAPIPNRPLMVIVRLVLAGLISSTWGLVPQLSAAPAKYRPAFSTTDLFAASNQMLLRCSRSGATRELWAGLDAKRMRTEALFLELSLAGSVEIDGRWRDLDSWQYDSNGTRSGSVHLRSDDCLITIDITSKKSRPTSPIFITYTFGRPVNFRWQARFKHADWIKQITTEDRSGAVIIHTLWQDSQFRPDAVDGPALVLAVAPPPVIRRNAKGEVLFECHHTRSIRACVDATEAGLTLDPNTAYADGWVKELGGTQDSESERYADRVRLILGDAKLQWMFDASVDAVRSVQFSSGVIMGDVFHYRQAWMRDGTYAAIGLALAGETADAEKYYEFWARKGGFSVGGEREAQQAGIVMTGLWLQSRLQTDGQRFLLNQWPSVSKNATYFVKRLEREGMLNLADEWISYSLAPASWPNAEVYSGLKTAAKIARQLGHVGDARCWDQAADKLQTRLLATAFDKRLNRFIPKAGPAGAVYTDPKHPELPTWNGPTRDERIDAGMLNLARLEVFGKGQGIVKVDDARFLSTQAQIVSRLEMPGHVLLGFEPPIDPKNHHSPKGMDSFTPTTAWAVQCAWLQGRNSQAWAYLLSGLLNRPGYDAQQSAYYIPELLHTNGSISVPFLTWGHGEFLTCTLLLLLGLDLEPAQADLGLAPSLPPHLDKARIENFSFRGWQLNIDLERTAGALNCIITDSRPGPTTSPLTIRLPGGRIETIRVDRAIRFTVPF